MVRSYFSYDATGALADHVSDIAVDNTTSAARLIKRTTPSYDPSTGNTMASMYQKGKSDVHYERMRYRLDGTLDTSRSSRTDVLWDVDAAYTYDKAGLMRREVLGADLVQGKDYVLTIAGQIKGIGHPSLDPAKDPGMTAMPRVRTRTSRRMLWAWPSATTAETSTEATAETRVRTMPASPLFCHHRVICSVASSARMLSNSKP